MSYFKFDEYDIHYEVYGNGKPLLFLNGIMMSCNSWKSFEEEISRDNQLILIDLLDQGKSSKAKYEYTQDIQVEIVKGLLDELNINKVSIMGTSYGGEVALQFVHKYQSMVEKLVLFNTVAKTNSWLKEIGDAWNLASENPEAYYCTTIPVIYSPQFYERKKDWMKNRKEVLINNVFSSKEFIDSMIRLTNSASEYDIVDKLSDINIPTLVIGSEQDHITPIEEQKLIVDKMTNAQLIMLPKTGHASFYERPIIFLSILKGFINLEKLDYMV